MSLRVETSSLIAGALVVGNRGLGVLGSSVPSTGDNGPGYLYNDLSFPADNDKEVRGLILTRPSAGTLYAYEDSSFEFTGAPDGSYTFTYRLFVDGVDTGVGTVNLQVGSPVAAVSATTALPVFSGGASVDGVAAEATISATTMLPEFSGGATVEGATPTVTIAATTALPIFSGFAGQAATATIAATTAIPVFSGSAGVNGLVAGRAEILVAPGRVLWIQPGSISSRWDGKMNFSEKKVAESVPLGFDLVRLLDVGESITGAAFSVNVLRGTDANPAAMVSGGVAIDGARVRQQIVGGVAGCYYQVAVSVTTSAGNVYEERGTLAVVP